MDQMQLQKKISICFLTTIIFLSFQIHTQEKATTWLEQGNKAYRSKRYDIANKNWQKIIEKHPNTPVWGKALYNIALLDKELGHYKKAIASFETLRNSNINDLEQGAHIMEAYRNYRPKAQWEIANCLLAMGYYQEALDAYRITQKKYPFQSWCGNAHALYRYKYAFYQGLCYEYLGKTHRAITYYYQAIISSRGFYSNSTVHVRIVDLYESAGMLPTLKEILKEMDVQFVKNIQKQLGDKFKQVRKNKLARLLPAKIMRRIMEIRNWGHKHQWSKLIGLLKIKGTVAGPEQPYARKGNWEAVEAATQLAKYAEKTTPLLVQALGSAKRADVKWIYYALGRGGTQKGLAVLKQKSQEETNTWWVQSVIYAISLMGEKGQILISDLEKTATRNLRGAIIKYRRGWSKDKNKVIFPKILPGIKLPSKLKEIG